MSFLNVCIFIFVGERFFSGFVLAASTDTHVHTRLFSGDLTAGDRLMVGDENSEVVAVFPAPPSGPDQVRKEGGGRGEKWGEQNSTFYRRENRRERESWVRLITYILVAFF